MTRRKPTRPTFESLEQRSLMAVDLDLDNQGRLVRIGEDATGQQGPVSLLVNSAGQVNVREGSTDLGTYPVAHKLSVALGAVTPGYVNLLQLDGQSLTTNLEVSLADQDPSASPTQFRILGGRVGVAATGTIHGDVREVGGTGSQFFLFGEQSQPIPHVIHIDGDLYVDVGPGGAADGAPEPVGSVGSPPAPSTVHVDGNVEVHNSTIFVLAGSVGGKLTVDSAAKVGTIPFLGTPGQLITLGNFGRPLTVGGNTRITTGSGADLISTENATFEGSLTIASGGGDDYLQLGNIDPSNDPGNPAFIYAPAAVRNDVRLTLGDGNDRVDFGADDGTTTVLFHVGGNLFVDAGSGDDSLNLLQLQVDRSQIQLKSGAQNDTVYLQRIAAPRAQLFAALGDGDDSLVIDNSATLALKALNLDGGSGINSWDPGNLASYAFRRRIRNLA